MYAGYSIYLSRHAIRFISITVWWHACYPVNIVRYFFSHCTRVSFRNVQYGRVNGVRQLQSLQMRQQLTLYPRVSCPFFLFILWILLFRAEYTHPHTDDSLMSVCRVKLIKTSFKLILPLHSANAWKLHLCL